MANDIMKDLENKTNILNRFIHQDKKKSYSVYDVYTAKHLFFSVHTKYINFFDGF